MGVYSPRSYSVPQAHALRSPVSATKPSRFPEPRLAIRRVMEILLRSGLQKTRFYSYHSGTGISFGMYAGKTHETVAEVTGVRLDFGSSRADYRAKVEQLRRRFASRYFGVRPEDVGVVREEYQPDLWAMAMQTGWSFSL
jgi:hypothetical protein